MRKDQDFVREQLAIDAGHDPYEREVSPCCLPSKVRHRISEAVKKSLRQESPIWRRFVGKRKV
jgi:hypothetical protein